MRLRILPAALIGMLITAAAYAGVSRPYETVGPWEIAMPDMPQTSCIGSRIYDQVIFSFAVAPDMNGTWSLWLTFCSKADNNPDDELIHALFEFGETQSTELVGISDGEGLVYFWTAATPGTLAALETAPYLLVTTKSGGYRYPLDGIDVAMNAASECWTEKQRREGIAM